MSSLKTHRTMQLAIGELPVSLKISDSAHEIADWKSPQLVNLAHDIPFALDNPHDFPPLSLAIVEDDRIAIAVEPGVPQVKDVVLQTIQYLLQHGVLANQISVLLARDHEELVEPLKASLQFELNQEFDVRFHHGDEIESMGYLAAAHGAEPIYVDRSLLEADVVLPITCARDPQAWAYAGLYGIVPWFTDSQTQNRWRHDCAAECNAKKETRLRAAKEVAWLLGIQPVIAVVPGPLGEIDSVFFGSVDAVEKAIDAVVQDRSIPRPAEKVDLVVASIDGDKDQQSWENVARVLYMAENFLKAGGTVAVITKLNRKPGNVFRWLGGLDEPEATEHHLMRSNHPQSLAAIEIHRARQRHTVYLMSQLPVETVEEVGMGAISGVEEIEHLIASHESCLVISGAQHRWIND